MSRVTVIREDGAVYVDGSAVTGLPDQAWNAMPSSIHALQWDGEAGKGEIEFFRTNGVHPPNEPITALPGWAQGLLTAREQRLQQLQEEEETP